MKSAGLAMGIGLSVWLVATSRADGTFDVRQPVGLA
jgi:hypothetical protein